MTYQRINCKEAKHKIFDHNNQVIIVDIRDEASYAVAHIEEAISLNDSTLTSFIESTDFDTPLLVYCYHGNSSQQAGQYLAAQGFSKVYSLDGGFEEWKQLFPETLSQ